MINWRLRQQSSPICRDKTPSDVSKPLKAVLGSLEGQTENGAGFSVFCSALSQACRSAILACTMHTSCRTAKSSPEIDPRPGSELAARIGLLPALAFSKSFMNADLATACVFRQVKLHKSRKIIVIISK